MSDNHLQIPFSTLLASSVHDMKNILGSVLESMDWLSGGIKELTDEESQEFQKVSQLVAHVNSELMQLLCFFKFEHGQYKTTIRESVVSEFLSLQQAFLQPLIKGDSCTIEIECDEELVWYYDETLISSAIRNAAMNALKFAKSKVVIQAIEVSGKLVFTVEDDGNGFPQDMLGLVDNRLSGVDFQTGSTGLGLYFAETVAKLHQNNQASGTLELKNHPKTGGAVFEMIIP